MEDHWRTRRPQRMHPEDGKHILDQSDPYWANDRRPTPPSHTYMGGRSYRRPSLTREERDREDPTPLIYLRWIKEDLEQLLRSKQSGTEQEMPWSKRHEADEKTGEPTYATGTSRRHGGAKEGNDKSTKERTRSGPNLRRWDPSDRYHGQKIDEEKEEPTTTYGDRERRALEGMYDITPHRYRHNINNQEQSTLEGRPNTYNMGSIPLNTHRPHYEELYKGRQQNKGDFKTLQTHRYTQYRRETTPHPDHDLERSDTEDEREDYNDERNQPKRRPEPHNTHLETIKRLWTGPLPPHTYTRYTNPATTINRITEIQQHNATNTRIATPSLTTSWNMHTPHNPQYHKVDITHNNTKEYKQDISHENTPRHHPINTLSTKAHQLHYPQTTNVDCYQPPHQVRVDAPHMDREHGETRHNINTTPYPNRENTPYTRQYTRLVVTTIHDINDHNQTQSNHRTNLTRKIDTRVHQPFGDTTPDYQREDHYTLNPHNQTPTHSIQRHLDRTPQYTNRTALDADTATNVHLQAIWKAIHAYGKTIPLQEWTIYKKQIQTALNIAHQTRQKDRHTMNTRTEDSYTHLNTRDKMIEDQPQAHTFTEQNRQTIRHPYMDPDTHNIQKTLQPEQTMRRDLRQRQGTEHIHPLPPSTRQTPHQPKFTNDAPKTGARPYPHNAVGTTPIKPRNTISWADIVKKTPTKPATKTQTILPYIQPDTTRHPHTDQQEEIRKRRNEDIHIPQPPYKYKHTPHITPTTQQRQPDLTDTPKATFNKINKQDTESETNTQQKSTQLQEHETALIQHWIWKTRKAENVLTEDTFKDRDHINYYTNILAGPPAYLSDTQKDTWVKEIHKTKEKCRTDILIPALDTKANYWKKRRQEVRPVHNQKEVEIDKIIKHVWHIWEKKGFRNRDISKIFREANLYEDFIPAPPPPTSKTPFNTVTIDAKGITPHTQPHPTHPQTHIVDRVPNQTTPTKRVVTTKTNLSKQTQTLPPQEASIVQTRKQTTRKETYSLHTTDNKQSSTATPHTHLGTVQNTYTKTATGYAEATGSEGRIESIPNKHTTPPSKETDTDTNTLRHDRDQTSPEVRNTSPNKIDLDTQDVTQKTDNTKYTNLSPNIRTSSRKTPSRHPTPIAVETPKQHPTFRPRTFIDRTQIGKQTSKSKSTIHRPQSKPQAQIDLTVDISPGPSSTPSRTKALEDEIIFYTPIRHAHTPQRDRAPTTHTPARTIHQTQETHKNTPLQAHTEHPLKKGHKLQAPQTQQIQTHKHIIEKKNTQNHPHAEEITIIINNSLAKKNTAQHKTTTATLFAPLNKHINNPSIRTHTSDDTHIQPSRTYTQHTFTHSNTPEVANVEKLTRTPIYRIGKQPGTTCKKDTQAGITTTNKTITQQIHLTSPRIQEEQWKTLCDETLVDIDWESVKQFTSTTMKITTPPQPHQRTPIYTNTKTDAPNLPTETTMDPTTENRWKENTVEITTKTDSQDRHQDTGSTNLKTNTTTNINHQTPQEEIDHQHIHKAIQEAIHRHTQAETPGHRHEDHRSSMTDNDHVESIQPVAQTKTDKSKLKNLKRKYLREQKRVREGTSKHRTNTDSFNMETQNTVFDYTTRGLTKSEREVLGLGKSFIITQNTIDIDRIKTDIATFIRRLRLHYIFRERRKDQTQTNQNLGMQRKHTKVQQNRQAHKGIHTNFRKPKSTFQPEETQRDINQIERNIEINIAAQLTHKKRGHPNIPTDWMAAIDTLKHRIADKEITITQADKGGGIIVVDYTTYIDKGTRYIEEEAEAYAQDYTPEELIIAKLIKERDRVTKQLKELDIIPIDTGTYATHQTIEKITGMKFYYKIHKTTDIHTMPVRPLQSCIGSPTQHISQVLTDIYEPYINNMYIPTHIRDTNHTLYELDGTRIRENDTLAIADVVALYPSIEHDKGLKAIKEFTMTHIHNDEQKAGALTEAFKLVITQNYVKWQGNIYKQTRGVAMGTPVAVTYANIYMNAIDNKIAGTCTYIKLHRRFIDDNLFIIPRDKKEEFTRTLNNIDPPTLKYTVTYLGDPPHVETIPFLDIKFYLNADRELYTRLYTKDTDKHQYLMPHSQHPRHIIRNIPRGVFARIRRLCKDDIAYQEDSELALNWLKKRGYKLSILTHIRQETGMKDRWQMIRDIEDRSRKTMTTEQTPTLIPFINTYSTPTKEFSNIIHNQQETLNTIFTKAKIKTLNAYRRKQNLGDLLMQPSLRIPIEGIHTTPRNFRKCGKHPHTKPCPCTGLHNQTLCRVCAHIDQDNIKIKTKIRRPITCDSKNLIYMIWCDTCKLTYIGETQQKLRDRFTQHLRNLDNQDQEFYNHFKTPGHQALHMKIAVLETLQTDEPLYRKIKESTWITHLKTYTPHGLNSKVKESPLDALQAQPKHTTNLQKDHPISTHTADTRQQTLDKCWQDNTQAITTTTDTPNLPIRAHDNNPLSPPVISVANKQTNKENPNIPRSPKPVADDNKREHKTQPKDFEAQQHRNKTPGRPLQHDTIPETTPITSDTPPKPTTPKLYKTNMQATTYIQNTQRKSTSVLTRQPRRINKAPPQTQ